MKLKTPNEMMQPNPLIQEHVRDYIKIAQNVIKSSYSVPVTLMLCFEPSDSLIDLVLDAVCQVFDLSVVSLKSKARDREHAEARKVFVWICIRHLSMNKTAVGKLINRTRFDVRNAFDAACDLIQIGDELFITNLNKALNLLSDAVKAQ